MNKELKTATIIYLEDNKVILNAITLSDDIKKEIKDFLLNIVRQTDVTRFDTGQKYLKSAAFVAEGLSDAHL